MKRFLDVLVAGTGLLLMSPVLFVAAIAVRITSPGPVLFWQERIGRGGRPFSILKFRTMVQNAATIGGPITFGNDPRVTPVGRLLRKTKLDELPQLLNVLKGDMSLVGPRPEVRRYVEMFHEDYGAILQVRPGMTDLASIKYRDEQAILGSAADPEQEYVHVVLPEKIRLAKEYVARQSFWLDLRIILGTAACLLCDRMPRASSRDGAQGSS
jgi:lipopolysaccharide/colanic/teichoic acid biosynthesis glycosyltransferase